MSIYLLVAGNSRLTVDPSKTSLKVLEICVIQWFFLKLMILCYVYCSESDHFIYRLYFKGYQNFNTFSCSGLTFIFVKHMLYFVRLKSRKVKQNTNLRNETYLAVRHVVHKTCSGKRNETSYLRRPKKWTSNLRGGGMVFYCSFQLEEQFFQYNALELETVLLLVFSNRVILLSKENRVICVG